MDKQELIVHLLREEHRDWETWINYMFDVGKTNKDGSFTIPVEHVQTWLKWSCTSSKLLDEHKKQIDLFSVLIILPLIEEYKDTCLAEATELLKAWKDLPCNAMSRSLISAHHLKKKQELDERTASFLEKEGK